MSIFLYYVALVGLLLMVLWSTKPQLWACGQNLDNRSAPSFRSQWLDMCEHVTETRPISVLLWKDLLGWWLEFSATKIFLQSERLRLPHCKKQSREGERYDSFPLSSWTWVCWNSLHCPLSTHFCDWVILSCVFLTSVEKLVSIDIKNFFGHLLYYWLHLCECFCLRQPTNLSKSRTLPPTP